MSAIVATQLDFPAAFAVSGDAGNLQQMRLGQHHKDLILLVDGAPCVSGQRNGSVLRALDENVAAKGVSLRQVLWETQTTHVGIAPRHSGSARVCYPPA